MFSFLKKPFSGNAEKPFSGNTEKSPTESAAVQATPEKRSWISRLKSGLARTGNQLTDLFSRGGKIDDDLYEELETILITSDVGMDATRFLLA